jgi:hypothetical protein
MAPLLHRVAVDAVKIPDLRGIPLVLGPALSTIIRRFGFVGAGRSAERRCGDANRGNDPKQITSSNRNAIFLVHQ